LKDCAEIKKNSTKRVNELNDKLKNSKSIREREHKEAEQNLKNARTQAEKARKAMADDQQKAESLQLEIEELTKQMVSCEQQLNQFRTEIVDKRKEVTEFEERVNEVKQRVSELSAELKEHKRLLKTHSDEMSKMQKQRESVLKKAEENELKIKQIKYEIEKIKNSSAESAQNVKHMKRKNPWIEEERHLFGNESAGYVRFDYKDPHHNFDRSAVIGVVCNLFRVRDTKYAYALEKAVGGRLYNVVMRDSQSAKAILDRGQLRERRTLIPLDRIQGYDADPRALKRARNIVGHENVDYAINYVDYDPSLSVAMKHVFGDTMIVPDMEIAKRIVYEVHKTAVTLDGEVIEPSGVLSGGSTSQGTQLLAKVAEILDKRRMFEELKHSMTEMEREFQNLNKDSKNYMTTKQSFELKEREAELVRQRLQQGNSAHSLMEEIEALRQTIETEEKALKDCAEIKKNSTKRVNELNDKLKNSKSIREREHKEAEQNLKNARTQAEKARKAMADDQQKAESLQLEIEELTKQMVSCEQQLNQFRTEIVDKRKEVTEFEERVNEVKQRVSELSAELKEHKRLLKTHSDEMSKMQKQRESVLKKAEENELKIKQIKYEIEKIKNSSAESAQNVKHMKRKNPWIEEERHLFGNESAGYGFNNFDGSDSNRRLERLKSTKASLAKTVNMRANIMLSDKEKESEELSRKRGIVATDKYNLIHYMEEMDQKKKDALFKAWEKINVDFGDIFSTFLPNSNAKLEAPEGKDVTDGLEVKVAFGDVWKDSLTELSGGQRSLVALSLILALLKYNPAPLYILDEVDAALDQSHTQNTGIMIRTHFRNSQFIIVSLKDDMFNNANVLFKTRLLKTHSDEMSKMQKQRESVLKKAEENELKIKQIKYEIEKIKNSSAESAQNVKHMKRKNPWIEEERHLFGNESAGYGFNNFDGSDSNRRLERLKSTKASLAKTVNMRANIMLSDKEKESEELSRKRGIVATDKYNLIHYMEEMDQKKKDALFKAWEKINVDFGDIFSTFLPNSNAKLEAPEGKDVTDGLEVKVAFGDVWKDSLTELSGGQRSLVALSLILALLKYNPAPLYILDEVDAALDQSHTQNTGIMIRTHFRNSQFIIVSLKDDMFNNANVLFKTRSHQLFVHRKHQLIAFPYKSCQPLSTSSKPSLMGKKAILLGVYEKSDDKDNYVFTQNATKFDETIDGKLTNAINIIGPLKKSKCRVFYGLSPSHPVVAVVGLGPNNAGYNDAEEVDEDRENIRTAIAVGARTLRDIGTIDEIDVDDCGDGVAAAEGSHLILYNYDELKGDSLKKPVIKLNHLNALNDSSAESKWNYGQSLAVGQNFTRKLMETPANLMTPTKFANIAVQELTKLGVEVHVRDRAWAEAKKMGSFLSVANGSDEPPIFLELHYNNAPNTKPLVFVGKGITFDSGGISLKPSANMDKMRADMGGAANVFGAISTLAATKAAVNVIGEYCHRLT
ncbi:unnamed protein product, partial [Medioppia subpectinata]